MDEKPTTIFEQFAINGSKALEIIRETAYSPQQIKTLKRWGITEISDLVGRSANYIRKQEAEGKLPKPNLDDNSNRRMYSLSDINQLRDIFGTRPSKLPADEPAIIAFANFKGGVAKSTSSVNFAQFLSKKGFRVLLIDCDSQASTTQMFGYTPDEHIEDDATLLPFLLEEKDSLEQVIRKTYWDGLDLIPSNLALYNAELMLPIKNAKEAASNKRYPFYNLLNSCLSPIKKNYDVVILDCPPSLGMISINALYAANAIVIPTPPAMLDFTSTVQFFYMIDETLSRLPQKEYSFIRIMITKHDGRASSDAIVHILRQLYGKYVMLNMMFATEVIKKASADMLSIYEIDKYAGSKKTLDRALQLSDNVFQELESLINLCWQNKSVVSPHKEVSNNIGQTL